MMASSLPDSEALGKGLPSVTLYKNSVGKVVFAKCFSLGKGWNEKNTKNIEFFLFEGGPHQPVPARLPCVAHVSVFFAQKLPATLGPSLSIFHAKFAAMRPAWFEPVTSHSRGISSN